MGESKSAGKCLWVLGILTITVSVWVGQHWSEDASPHSVDNPASVPFPPGVGREEVPSIRRSEVDEGDGFHRVLLWNKQLDKEAPWDSDACSIRVGGGAAGAWKADLHGLWIFADSTTTFPLDIRVDVVGYATAWMSIQEADLLAEDPLRILLDGVFSQPFHLVGDSRAFSDSSALIPGQGFYISTPGDARIQAEAPGVYSARVMDLSSATGYEIGFHSKGVGLHSWSLPSGSLQGEVIPLQLPPVTEFTFTVKKADGIAAVEVELLKDEGNGLTRGLWTKLLDPALSHAAIAFAGAYRLRGVLSDGRSTFVDFQTKAVSGEEKPQHVVLDFSKLVAHRNQSISQRPPAPSPVVVPTGKVRFELEAPSQQEAIESAEVRLWQFTSTRTTRRHCRLGALPSSLPLHSPLEMEFRGVVTKEPEALFALEVSSPALKQAGFALLEVPSNSSLLDFGSVPLFSPGEFRLFISGLSSSRDVSVAMAQSSLMALAEADVVTYSSRFHEEDGCYIFSDVTPGRHEVGVFHSGQLIATSTLEVEAGEDGLRPVACRFDPPGKLLLLVADLKNPIEEILVRRVGGGFWPSDQEFLMTKGLRELEVLLPAGQETVVCSTATLGLGGGRDYVQLIPVQLGAGEHRELDLSRPDGGVIRGRINVSPEHGFLFVMASSNRSPFTWIQDDGTFCLTGLEDMDLRLRLVDEALEKHPLHAFDPVILEGTLNPDGTVTPAE